MSNPIDNTICPACGGQRSSSSTVCPHCQSKPRRPLLEVLLDPKSIQWLLGFGGALLVLGLVIWLATLGIFKNPHVVAAALGLGNAALLGCGWAITSRTRYQTAGRALTLLSCLVMPLNLWFYHSHALMTLEGHLWVAALVCCVFYAASAKILRDSTFVYVLVGGVAMTGLLILCDMHKFWEIGPPATLLVVLGIVCLHVERAFADIEGPFSRKRFGMAFFWSGQLLLASGLLLVLGAQLAGNWLYKPFFEPIYASYRAGPPIIVAERSGQLLALGLVLAAIYAYAYSDLVVRRVGVYIFLAVLAVLWAEVLVIDLFAVSVTAEAAIIALALTSLLSNLIAPATSHLRGGDDSKASVEALALTLRPLNRAALPLGLILSALPVLLGTLLFLRATYGPLNLVWPHPAAVGQLYSIGWIYVAAMTIAAIACRVGAHLYRHHFAWLCATYFFGTAAATLLAVAGVLSLIGIRDWNREAALLMLIPMGYIIAARLYRGRTPENPLAWAAHGATSVIVASVLFATARVVPHTLLEPEAGTTLNLWLALILAEAASFYGMATAFRKRAGTVYLCTMTACGAGWQLLQYGQVGAEYYSLTFAIIGVLLLIAYRATLRERTGIAQAAFQCANALMSLSVVAAALLTLSRMAGPFQKVHWSLPALLCGLALLSLFAARLVNDASWRRWYLVMAIVEVALMFIAIHILSQLTIPQKLEVFSVAVGLALLAIGHVGWHREHESQEDLVSFSLFFGSMLIGVPLTLALLYHRFQPHFSPVDEFGMLFTAILLLATGFALQLRSTTITGATMLVTYLMSLLLFVNMLESVQKAAIWLTIGGGVIFCTGLLLSIYRDRLLMLPEQVKRREGVFRVLTWR